MSDNCPFCKLIKNKDVPETIPNVGVYYFEPLNPVTKGHRLFVPKEHYSNAGYHPAVTGLVVGQAVEYANKLYSDYNLIINNGKAASQTVGHMHVHIVPRVEGDGLILPWTNQPELGSVEVPENYWGLDVVLSVTSGILLTDIKNIYQFYEHLFGRPVWTHELHGLKDIAIPHILQEAGYLQHVEVPKGLDSKEKVREFIKTVVDQWGPPSLYISPIKKEQ